MSQKYTHSLSKLDTETETLQLSINLTPQHAITVIVTYKPPNVSASRYLSQLSDIIKPVTTKELVIMGDINLDWNDAVSKPLKTIAIKLGLYQLIKDSTRIGQTRRSILYLIFTNHPAKYALSGVIDIDISDHLLVYAIRKKIKPPTTHAHLSEPRISSSKLPQFNAEFREIDWSDQLSLGNPDVILAQFHTKLNIIQNKYTSIGKVRPRQVKLPWLNSQMLKLLKQKASSDRKSTRLNSSH